MLIINKAKNEPIIKTQQSQNEPTIAVFSSKHQFFAFFNPFVACPHHFEISYSDRGLFVDFKTNEFFENCELLWVA